MTTMNGKQYESTTELYKLLVAERSRIPPPSNPEQLIGRLESASLEMPRSELTASFKEPFILTTYLCWLSYRAKMRDQRRTATTQAALASSGNSGGIGATKRGADGEPRNGNGEQLVSVKNEKFAKPICVPDYARNCRSGVIRAATTLFCLNGGGFPSGLREAVKVRAMLHALYEEDGLTAGETVERFASMSRNELRQIPMPGPDKEYTTQTQQMLVQTLMELSDILPDKSYAKVAAALNEEHYIGMTKVYIKHNVMKTLHPYEHLFQRYLKECVAPKRIDEEQRKIQKQYAVDPKSIITFVLSELQEASERREKKKRAKRSTNEAAAVFVDGETYEVFRGPLNYRNDLVMRNVQHGDRFYWVITYNDCLYDVIGSSLDPEQQRNENVAPQTGSAAPVASQTTERDMRLYNHLPWSTRLKLIPFRGKISLQTMTSDELNRVQGPASLTVSWMENGFETNRTVNVRNDGKRTASTNAHC